jgi:hypothetical protein
MNVMWVSPTGNDIIGTGAFEAPFQTIEHALTLFNSGDQIRLLDGTYTPADSIIIQGKEGSIFSENPRGAYIQPLQTKLHQACVAILDSPRFSLVGFNVLQAADAGGNNIGIYAENVSNLLAYTCAVTDFTVPSGDAYGIYASGSGRIEGCLVSNFRCLGDNLYGIRADGVDIIDCSVTDLSGGGSCNVYGKKQNGLSPIGDQLFLGGSFHYYDGTNFYTSTDLTTDHITAVWAWAEDDIWAGGYTTGPIIKHWNGSIWTAYDLSGITTTGYVSSLWGYSPTTMYLSIVDFSGALGALLQWDGTSWAVIYSLAAPYTSSSVHGVSPSYVSIAVTVDIGVVVGVLGIWDGVFMEAAPGGFPGLVGSSCNGVYSPEVNNTLALFQDVATDAGSIYRYNGAAVVQDVSGVLGVGVNALFDINGTGPNDIWAVGAGSEVIHYDGVTWTRVAFPTPNIALRKLWIKSTNNIYLLGTDIGGVGYVFRWDGISWALLFSNSAQLMGMHGL